MVITVQFCQLEIIYFAEKIAQKFAKKANFSYETASVNLTKKEQKLSLDRACRKFLKEQQEDKSNETEETPNAKKRKNKDSIADEAQDIESPRKKKVTNLHELTYF